MPGRGLDEGNVLSVLSSLHEISLVAMAAISFLARADEARKLRKQEEFRRQMDTLAQQNMALEHKLAYEKQAAVDEKEAIEVQLHEALGQLEQAREQLDEMAGLKAELLKLQAASERYRVLVEALRTQVAEKDSQIGLLQSDHQSLEERLAQAEADKEDMAQTIAVLTEERDGAQVREEELFAELGEVRMDLERLQVLARGGVAWMHLSVMFY